MNIFFEICLSMGDDKLKKGFWMPLVFVLCIICLGMNVEQVKFLSLFVSSSLRRTCNSSLHFLILQTRYLEALLMTFFSVAIL